MTEFKKIMITLQSKCLKDTWKMEILTMKNSGKVLEFFRGCFVGTMVIVILLKIILAAV